VFHPRLQSVSSIPSQECPAEIDEITLGLIRFRGSGPFLRQDTSDGLSDPLDPRNVFGIVDTIVHEKGVLVTNDLSSSRYRDRNALFIHYFLPANV
jgi:hypothetical protein